MYALLFIAIVILILYLMRGYFKELFKNLLKKLILGLLMLMAIIGLFELLFPFSIVIVFLIGIIATIMDNKKKK